MSLILTLRGKSCLIESYCFGAAAGFGAAVEGRGRAAAGAADGADGTGAATAFFTLGSAALPSGGWTVCCFFSNAGEAICCLATTGASCLRRNSRTGTAATLRPLAFSITVVAGPSLITGLFTILVLAEWEQARK